VLVAFPDAQVTRIGDAGHYLQEDAHERIVPALLDFVGAP
jgi:pimeloyl-ACP methyl ester carboxylesterase